MRRVWRTVLTVLLLLAALVLPCAAQTEQPSLQDYTEDVHTQFSALLPARLPIDVTDPEALGEALTPAGLFTVLHTLVQGYGEQLLTVARQVACAVLLLALAHLLSPRAPALTGAVSLVVTVTLTQQLASHAQGVARAVEEATELFAGVAPLLVGIRAAGGATATAAAEAATLGATVGWLSLIGSVWLLPLCALACSLALLGGIADGAGELLGAVRRLVLWSMGLVGALLTASLALGGTLARATDALSLRGVRYALSGMLPAVGPTVAGSLGAVLTSLSYVQKTVGIGAVVALLLLLVPQLLVLLLCRAMLSVGEGILRSLTGRASALTALRGALDLLIGIGAMHAVLTLLAVGLSLMQTLPV